MSSSYLQSMVEALLEPNYHEYGEYISVVQLTKNVVHSGHTSEHRRSYPSSDVFRLLALVEMYSKPKTQLPHTSRTTQKQRRKKKR